MKQLDAGGDTEVRVGGDPALVPTATIKLETVSGGMVRPTVTFIGPLVSTEGTKTLEDAAVASLQRLLDRLPNEVHKNKLLVDGRTPLGGAVVESD